MPTLSTAGIPSTLLAGATQETVGPRAKGAPSLRPSVHADVARAKLYDELVAVIDASA